MRRLVEHTAAAIALAALMALLIPVSVAPLSDHSTASAITATTNNGAAAKTAAATADGRWKLGGDGSCYWDPDDAGPDQCSPVSGRWKLGGDGSCYFDANDSGPNQCEPPAASAATEARAISLKTALRPGV
jgi:hypothetical protein